METLSQQQGLSLGRVTIGLGANNSEEEGYAARAKED